MITRESLESKLVTLRQQAAAVAGAIQILEALIKECEEAQTKDSGA